MAKKRAKGGDPAKDSLTLERQPGEAAAATVARTLLQPSVNAALTEKAFVSVSGAELEVPALANELADQCAKVHGGDLLRAESLLVTQAQTLDAIFHNLARRSAANLSEYILSAERYMRLALKAQSQCRATLETLVMIKNPPMVIARQANIAHGPQQVNNGEPTRTRGIQSEPSKLLEQTHGERLDTGTAGQAIGGNPAMATVGAVNRSENGGR